VLTELFSLGVTAEELGAIIGSQSAISLQRGPVDPKFQVEGTTPHQPFFSQKTRLSDVSYGMKIWIDFVFRFVTIHAFAGQTDRQTDGRTKFSSLDRVCISCNAVKTGSVSLHSDNCFTAAAATTTTTITAQQRVHTKDKVAINGLSQN